MSEADEIIAKLGLQPLPHEGGFFARTWTGQTDATLQAPIGTAIYFLLTDATFSALHQLQTDELWHFYAGAPVEHWQLTRGSARAERCVLGPDILGGQFPQLIVPAGKWQGARLVPSPEKTGAKNSWALLGCTLAPGWTGGDFLLGERAVLLAEFPGAAEIIGSLTRVAASGERS
jgi:predicted cupin superfamily sugar epimerase